MAKQTFYICKHCGNIIAFARNSGVPVVCCGEKMQEIVPNTVEASAEKHIPVIDIKDNIVTVFVGSISHPMADEHHIAWISLETVKGNQRKELKPGELPSVTFALTEDDKPIASYAYCNLHGLWKKEI